MSTLCIEEQGAVLSRRDQRFVVRLKGKVLADIPAFRLEQIIIMGNIQITTEAMKLIFKHNVDTVFMSQKGKFYGRLFTPVFTNVETRMLQYEKSTDSEFKLKLAREIIRGKLHNCRKLLLRFNRKRNREVISSCFKIRSLINKLENADTIDSILGHEGAGSASHFAGFRELLKQDLGFVKRQRRPPKDPVNSMLSFGYTLLYREFSNIINLVGIDPYIAFLHTPENNRESLALDLMEEFRPMIDKIILTLVNRREVSQADFRKKEDDSVMISKKTIGLFMNRFYNALKEETYYQRLEENHTMRNVMQNQVRLLVRALKGEEDYKFFEL